MSDFKGRNIRPWRLASQLLGLMFVLGTIIGIPTLGTYPFLRQIFLPNASCRYINTAPTSCYYYQVQDGLVQGSSGLYLDLLILLVVVVIAIVLLGRFWCSWLCPFGAVQELLSWVRGLLRIPPLKLKWALFRQVQVVDRWRCHTNHTISSRRNSSMNRFPLS